MVKALSTAAGSAEILSLKAELQASKEVETELVAAIAELQTANKQAASTAKTGNPTFVFEKQKYEITQPLITVDGKPVAAKAIAESPEKFAKYLPKLIKYGAELIKAVE